MDNRAVVDVLVPGDRTKNRMERSEPERMVVRYGDPVVSRLRGGSTTDWLTAEENVRQLSIRLN